MLHIINNKGQFQVPRLESLAVVSPGLTQERLRLLPTNLRNTVIAVRQKLGLDTQDGMSGEVLMLTNEGILTVVPQSHIAKVDFRRNAQRRISQCIVDHRNLPISPEELDKDWEHFMSQSENVSIVFAGTWAHPNCIEVFCNTDGKLTACLDDKLISTSAFKNGTVMRTVERLILSENHSRTPPPICQYLDRFGSLTALEVKSSWIPSILKYIVRLREQLRELRLVFYCCGEASDITSLMPALSKMHRLQVLSITGERYSDNVPSIVMSSLPKSAALRSLHLCNLKLITSRDVIEFLLEEIDHEGEKFVRQDLITDLTLLNIPTCNFDELYQSERLHQTMKKRIYCNKDVYHFSAAMLVLQQKNTSFSIDSVESQLGSIFEFDEFSTQDKGAFPVLLWVLVQDLNRRYNAARWNYAGFLLLLATKQQAMQYDSALLRAATAAFTGTFHRLDEFDRVDIQPYLFEVLIILHECVEEPPHLPDYIKMLLAMLETKLDVSAPFMKHVNKLSETELKEMLDDRKAKLTTAAIEILIERDATLTESAAMTLPHSIDVTRSLRDMFCLIFTHTSDRALKVAANALVRRAAGPDDRNADCYWSSKAVEEEEQTLAKPILERFHSRDRMRRNAFVMRI